MAQCDIRAPAGVAFRDLDVFGYQKTFGNYPISFLERLRTWRKKKQIRILRNIEGVARGGELILVLGRPGSGCTTMLKTLGGQTDGLTVGEKAVVNYHGE
jgi:ATP-binding cassette subfamily G (WHITE) protein 2 (PDR)